jgi:hypothetical protein
LFEWAVVTSAKALEAVVASDSRAFFFRGQVNNLWRVLDVGASGFVDRNLLS